jgi:uncharacterized protein (DUF433 family)/DNA-binding transcriptional MerR regulator
LNDASVDGIELGSGVYSIPEATQILRRHGENVTARQLHYWLRHGLAETTEDEFSNFPLMTFDDLISFEVIRLLKGEGASLQAIRWLDRELKINSDFRRPFAHQLLFTDGAAIWAQIRDSKSQALELVGKRRGHFVWTDVIRSFAKEITWGDEYPFKALRWRLSRWVEIDPLVQFGQPVVRGSRTPVHTIASNLVAGTTKEVASWYGLDVAAVEGVKQYLVTA